MLNVAPPLQYARIVEEQGKGASFASAAALAALAGAAAGGAAMLTRKDVYKRQVLPLMAVMGFGVGIAGPSRDLLVRKAATQGLGEASFGRVYGFVYSGLDIGLATAPLIFGPIMDGGHFGAMWVGVALLQGLAVVSALRVGSRADCDRV